MNIHEFAPRPAIVLDPQRTVCNSREVRADRDGGWVCSLGEHTDGVHVAAVAVPGYTSTTLEAAACWSDTYDMSPAAADAAIEHLRPTAVARLSQINRLTAELDQTRTARDQATERLAALWRALEAEAAERGWCSDYDEFVEANGGPERERDWDVTLEVTTSIPNDFRTDRDIKALLAADGDGTSLAVDITESFTVTHRAHLVVTTTGKVMRAQEADLADERTRLCVAALRGAGYRFDAANDDFTVDEYEPA